MKWLLALVLFFTPLATMAKNNPFGVHLLIQDALSSENIKQHLTWAKTLVGEGGYVKCFFYGITRDTLGADNAWKELINAIYDNDMIPIVRLQGIRDKGLWVKPEQDEDGSFTSIAEAFARVVADLPKRAGKPIYVEIWNEPNLAGEWSDEANPVEYARFFVATSRAIKSLGDRRVKVLNAGLAPGGWEFLEEMCKNIPEFVHAFDVWASHPYPGNFPPEINLHDKTARIRDVCIDSYLLEFSILAHYGRNVNRLKVILTETGYELGNQLDPDLPPIDEELRAEYIMRAFRDYWTKWPEVLAVTPFSFCDPYGSWQRFDWVYPDSDTDEHGWPTHRHLQYDAVAALAKPTSKWGSVSGHIKDSVTNAPVIGAKVEIFPGSIIASTNNLGTYLIPFLHPGNYFLLVKKEGYDSMKIEGVEVKEGENKVIDMTLVAIETGTISGKVVDSRTHKGIKGAAIITEEGNYAASSDEKGAFVIEGLPPGNYTIVAAKEGYYTHRKIGVSVKPSEITRIRFFLGKGEVLEDNLLRNADFERVGKDSFPLCWSKYSEGEAKITLDEDEKYNGDRALAIVFNGPGFGKIYQWSNYNVLTPCNYYILQGWVRTESFKGGGVIRICFYNEKDEPIASPTETEPFSGTQGWEFVNVKFTAPPGARRFKIELVGEGKAGKIWFDHIYVGERR